MVASTIRPVCATPSMLDSGAGYVSGNLSCIQEMQYWSHTSPPLLEVRVCVAYAYAARSSSLQGSRCLLPLAVVECTVEPQFVLLVNFLKHFGIHISQRNYINIRSVQANLNFTRLGRKAKPSENQAKGS